MSFFGGNIRTTSATFESGGRSVTIREFLPAAPGKYPAVLALHGSGGIREGWSDQPSRLMAGQGYSVFLVHYFERTGTIGADREATQRHFPDWMRTIGDAITFAMQHDSVDPSRVALLGF